MDNTYEFIVWQQLVIRTQELAIKMPETGLNPDVIPLMPIEQVIGTLTFLKRLYAQGRE